MDVSTPGLTQWTMESAMDGHPEIVVQAAPGTDIECSVICQSLSLTADEAEVLIVGLALGQPDDGALRVRATEADPMVLVVGNTDGDHLNLHSLDVIGFTEKLALAREITTRGN